MKNLVVINRSGKELLIPEMRKRIPWNGKQVLLPEPIVQKYRGYLEIVPVELIQKAQQPKVDPKIVNENQWLKKDISHLRKIIDLNSKMLKNALGKRRKSVFDFLYSFHFNDEAQLKDAVNRLRCSIQSIIDQDVNVCVSNTSEHDIEDMIKDLGDISYIHRPVNVEPYCKSQTINIGVKELVKSPNFFLSDIDLIYSPDFINNARKYILLDKARVVFYNCNLGNECPNVSDYKKCEEMFRIYPDQSRTQVGIAPGNGLVNLKAFKEVKGFDESFVGYGWEDADFNKRIAKVAEYIEDSDPAMRTYHLYHENQK